MELTGWHCSATTLNVKFSFRVALPPLCRRFWRVCMPVRRLLRHLEACKTVQNPMQKATILARSACRSGGCSDTLKRAKPDAKSDDFDAVWTQVQRVLRLLEACKSRCKKRRFWRSLDASGRRSGGCNASLKRAKPDAKSDDFGAVWTLLDAGPKAVTLP